MPEPTCQRCIAPLSCHALTLRLRSSAELRAGVSATVLSGRGLGVECQEPLARSAWTTPHECTYSALLHAHTAYPDGTRTYPKVSTDLSRAIGVRRVPGSRLAAPCLTVRLWRCIHHSPWSPELWRQHACMHGFCGVLQCQPLLP